MTVLQGFLLLVILSTLFSVCISLLMTGVRADLKDLNEKSPASRLRLRKEMSKRPLKAWKR